MVREGRGPRGYQCWRTFIANHAKEVWACDFLVQHTALFARAYVFVIMEIESRRIVCANVTSSPSIAWVKQQIRNATPWGEAPRFLVHDNDAIFGQFGKPVVVEKNATPEHLDGPPLASPAVFAVLLPLVAERPGPSSTCGLALTCSNWSCFGSLPSRTKSYRCHLDRWLDDVMGIEGLPIPYGAPNASPHIERLMRTLREQALNHFIFLSEDHIRKVVAEYVSYYNHARPHQSLHAIPDPYPELRESPPEEGKLVALPVLGGIRHDYRLAA